MGQLKKSAPLAELVSATEICRQMRLTSYLGKWETTYPVPCTPYFAPSIDLLNNLSDDQENFLTRVIITHRFPVKSFFPTRQLAIPLSAIIGSGYFASPYLHFISNRTSIKLEE